MVEIAKDKTSPGDMEVVKRPICNQRMFDIEDKSKCKTNIAIKCIRCKKIIWFFVKWYWQALENKIRIQGEIAFCCLTFYSSGTISFFTIRILFLKWKKLR